MFLSQVLHHTLGLSGAQVTASQLTHILHILLLLHIGRASFQLLRVQLPTPASSSSPSFQIIST